MTGMNNAQIAEAFDLIADLLEIQAANPFRVRAYRRGARVVREWPESLARVAMDEPERLTTIEGIGRDLADKILALIDTGSVPLLEELRAQIPPSVLDLMRIPGLGPKKAAVLQRELGINTLDDLRAACQAHRLRELKGFGAKTEAAIAAGIDLAAAPTSEFTGPRPISSPKNWSSTCGRYRRRTNRGCRQLSSRTRNRGRFGYSDRGRTTRRPPWIGWPNSTAWRSSPAVGRR